VLCTNTMHEIADVITAAVTIPFVHIADATATAIKAAGLTKVAMLATRYTMERAFYRGRLEAVHHLGVLIPDVPDRTLVHQVIYDELVQGVIRDESRQRYLEIIGRLRDRNAEGVIAGCTEIELLVKDEDVDLPYFPTTQLHALAAVNLALANS
jgi:aspartate racemase